MDRANIIRSATVARAEALKAAHTAATTSSCEKLKLLVLQHRALPRSGTALPCSEPRTVAARAVEQAYQEELPPLSELTRRPSGPPRSQRPARHREGAGHQEGRAR